MLTPSNPIKTVNSNSIRTIQHADGPSKREQTFIMVILILFAFILILAAFILFF